MSGFISNITYEGAVAPTPSDTVNDPHGPFAAIYVGSGGNIQVTTLRGQTALFVAVPTGTTLRIACLRVWSSNLGAGSLLGLQAMPYPGK